MSGFSRFERCCDLLKVSCALLLAVLPGRVAADTASEEAAVQAEFVGEVQAARTVLNDFLVRMEGQFGTGDVAEPARTTVAMLGSLQALAEADARVARDFAVTLGDLINAAWRRSAIYSAQTDWVSPEPELVAAEPGPTPYGYVREQQYVLERILRDYELGARPYPAASIARHRRGLSALKSKLAEIETIFTSCLRGAADDVGRFGYAIGTNYQRQRERSRQAETLERQRLQTEDLTRRQALGEQIELLRDEAYDAYRQAESLNAATSGRMAAAFAPCFEQLRLAVSAPVMAILPPLEDFPESCQPEIVWRCVREVGPFVRVAVPTLTLLDAREDVDKNEVAEKVVEAVEKGNSSQISGRLSILSMLSIALGGERSRASAEADKASATSSTTLSSQVEASVAARVAAATTLTQDKVRERIERRNVRTDIYEFTANTEVTGNSRWLVREIEAYVSADCPAAVPAPTLTIRVEQGAERTGRFDNERIEVWDPYYPNLGETGKGKMWAMARANDLFLQDLERMVPALSFPPPVGRSGNLNVSVDEAQDCVRR